MTAQYTPGGWHRNIAPASRYPIVFAGRNTHVARVITQGLPEPEQEANANLIAAAPALLEALQTILPRLAGVDLKTARAAIALAYGDYETWNAEREPAAS